MRVRVSNLDRLKRSCSTGCSAAQPTSRLGGQPIPPLMCQSHSKLSMNFLKADYPCVADIIIVLKQQLAAVAESNQECDLDELVYEAISLWDECFEDDNEWFNEDETDLKDSLRDQVLEFIS